MRRDKENERKSGTEFEMSSSLIRDEIRGDPLNDLSSFWMSHEKAFEDNPCLIFQRKCLHVLFFCFKLLSIKESPSCVLLFFLPFEDTGKPSDFLKAGLVDGRRELLAGRGSRKNKNPSACNIHLERCRRVVIADRIFIFVF
jgi:hypothetical protein